PAAAKKNTKEGAAAFGKYYYEKLGEASHTGETDDLTTLGSQQCPPCDQVVSNIDADAKKGQTRSADPYSFSDLSAVARKDEGFKVSMTVKVKAHDVYEDGKDIGDVRATKYTLT